MAFVCLAMLVPAAGAEAAKCTQKGTGGVDVLKGTKGKDVLCGKGGDDVLIGKGGNDVLKGAAGKDTLTGKAGNDTLAGGAGDDALSAGKGDDKFKGGGGIDVAAFADSKAAVAVDLSAGTANGDGADTLATVEDVIGSPFGDQLSGDAAANVLNAGDGDDQLQGGAGDDTLAGQAGIDSTSFAGLGVPVIADLRAGTVSGDGTDAISGVEHLTGTSHDDTIAGDDADNVLDAGAGRDLISYAGAPGPVDVDIAATGAIGDGSDSLQGFEDVSGSAHADRLAGTAGPNLIQGGEGDDVLIGQGGDDSLQGGGGMDSAAYESSDNGVDGDLRASRVTGQGTDTLAGVESLDGSAHNDNLAGDAGPNVLNGHGGSDTVSFAAAPQLVDASLSTGVVSGDGADTVLGVENAIGSPHDDSIEGNSADNAIAGGQGNDTIAADQGDDEIYGENGNDRLFGADEDDGLYGAAGNDMLDGGGGVNECDGGTGVNTYAGNCDGTAPVLTAFGLSPSTIDTSGAAQSVDFTLSISDDSAGVDPAASSVIVRAPTGNPVFTSNVQLVTGTPVNGGYTAQIQLPRFAAQGTWTVDVRLTDHAGNSALMTSAQLNTAGFAHNFLQQGAGDDSGPVLTNFSRSPDTVNTSSAPGVINLDLTITDDLAGVDVNASRVIVTGPGGAPSFEAPLESLGGNEYEATVTIPQFSAPGSWTIQLLLVDSAGNETPVSPLDLAPNGGFEQVGAGDTQKPSVTLFGRSPAQINTAELDQFIDINLNAVDDLSGIDAAASRVIAYDPVNQPRAESPLTLTSGSPTNGGYTAQILIPHGSATGTWKLEVELIDEVGNVEVFTSAELAAAGFPSTFQNVAPSGT